MKAPLYLTCICTQHLLQVKPEEVDGFESRNVELSIWVRPETQPLTWRERMRWIWHILRTGELWGDQVILDKIEVKQLQDYLNDFTHDTL